MALEITFHNDQQRKLILEAVRNELDNIRERELELAKERIEKQFNELVARLTLSLTEDFDVYKNNVGLHITVRK